MQIAQVIQSMAPTVENLEFLEELAREGGGETENLPPNVMVKKDFLMFEQKIDGACGESDDELSIKDNDKLPDINSHQNPIKP